MLVSPVMRLRVPVLTRESRGGLGQNAMTFFEGSSKNGTDGQSSTVTVFLSVSTMRANVQGRSGLAVTHDVPEQDREITSALASAHNS